MYMYIHIYVYIYICINIYIYIYVNFVCDMPHACVPWPLFLPMCDMTNTHVCHNRASFLMRLCVTWLTRQTQRECRHSDPWYLWYDQLIPESPHTAKRYGRNTWPPTKVFSWVAWPTWIYLMEWGILRMGHDILTHCICDMTRSIIHMCPVTVTHSHVKWHDSHAQTKRASPVWHLESVVWNQCNKISVTCVNAQSDEISGSHVNAQCDEISGTDEFQYISEEISFTHVNGRFDEISGTQVNVRCRWPWRIPCGSDEISRTHVNAQCDWISGTDVFPYAQLPRKSPIISGSFAENDLQLQASFGCERRNPWHTCGCAMWIHMCAVTVTYSSM